MCAAKSIEFEWEKNINSREKIKHKHKPSWEAYKKNFLCTRALWTLDLKLVDMFYLFSQASLLEGRTETNRQQFESTVTL